MSPPRPSPSRSRPRLAPSRRILLAALVAGVLGLAPGRHACAQLTSRSAAPPDTTGFALVLGGGGARGLAHIGVLRALEELGMRPSLIVGTSMGAVLGSLYAAGNDATQLEALLAERAWMDFLLDEREPSVRVQGGWHGLPRSQLRLRLDQWPLSPPSGVSSGQSVESLVGALSIDALVAADGQFDGLPIPFRALCTDVVAAVPVVHDRGALPRVVRASGSLPLVFVPVEYEGRMLMDGGILDNLPVEVARELGFSRSLIVDVSNIFLPQQGPPENLFSLLRRTAQLSQLRQNAVEPAPGDILLRLDLNEHLALGFWGAEELQAKGYAATMAIANQLTAMRDERGLAAQGPPPAPVALGPVVLGSIEVVGARRMSGWAVRRRMGLRENDRIELRELWRRAEDLGRQAAFEHAWVDAWRGAGGRVDVTIHVVERDHPEAEFSGNYREGEGASLLTRLRLDNRLGSGSAQALSWRLGEERTALSLDLAQDLGRIRQAEVRFTGGWMRERAEIFVEGDEVDAWTFRRWGGDLDLVASRPDWPIALWAGVRAETVHRARESRAPGSAGDTEWRALHLGLESWTGSSFNASPPRGLSAHLELGQELLGGDHQAWRLAAGWVGRRLLGPYLGVNAGTGLGWASGDLPVELQARAGGPRGWVGLRRDEILAPRLLWQRVGFDVFFQREARLELAAAVGWWGTESLDEHRPRVGAQLQLVLDTLIGPAHLGVAGSRRGESFAFVDVGYEF